MVICTSCIHMASEIKPALADARSVAARRELARQGHVFCVVNSAHQGDTYSALYERECKSFLAAPAGVVAKRMEWMAQKQLDG